MSEVKRLVTRIVGVKSRSTVPTLVYCVLMVGVVWVINLWYVWQPSTQAAWEKLGLTLSRGEAIAMMCFVLGMITMFSLFPVVIYVSCNWLDWYNAQKRTERELQRCFLWDELESEVQESFRSYYAETYRLPIVLATLAMIVGWVFFFFSGGPDAVWELASSRNLSAFFLSLGDVHPVVFGFLGAFFFSLQVLVRRYFAADLKAVVFMHIAVRTWLVMILTLVLSVVWPAASSLEGGPDASRLALLATCFIAGIIPDVALDLIQKAAKTGLGKLRLVSDADAPLTSIQGLNLWHQARLAEESIDNVQNLAQSDIVGLLANTRLGVMRLLDWIDQALLCIHVGDDFERYRQAGIHTATEFYFAYEKRTGEDSDLALEKLAKALPPKDNEDAEERKERVFNQLTAVRGDTNFQKLRRLLLQIQAPEKKPAV